MFARAEVGTYHNIYYFTTEVAAAAAAVFDYGYCQLSALAACINFSLQPRAESLALKCFSEFLP